MTDIQTDTLPSILDTVPTMYVVHLADGAPQWARELNDNLLAVAKETSHIKTVHEKILTVVEELKPEVLGVVESLRSNPMFKMLLGGKK